MKLEIKILAALFLTFMLLNLILNNPNENSNDELSENTSNNQIGDSEFIINQITQNKTQNEITNLTNKDNLKLQEELEQKNQIFIQITENQPANKSNETTN